MLFKSKKILNIISKNTNLLLLIMKEKWYTRRRVFLFGFPIKQSEKE